MTDNTELLPCPMCGNDVTMEHVGNEHTKSRKIEIKCNTFGCTITYRMGAMKCGFDWLESEITKAWNTRAGETQLALENQQLGEALRIQDKRIGELEEALEFYAKESTYELYCGYEVDGDVRNEVNEKAKQALNKQIKESK